MAPGRQAIIEPAAVRRLRLQAGLALPQQRERAGIDMAPRHQAGAVGMRHFLGDDGAARFAWIVEQAQRRAATGE